LARIVDQGKAGRDSFKDKHLTEGPVVMAWHAPLVVVVLDIKRITTPWAALNTFCHVATFVGFSTGR
jgi:hypothetical protein